MHDCEQPIETDSKHTTIERYTVLKRLSWKDMKIYERSLLEEKLRDAGQRLNKAQAQIEVLDKQIRELEVLYKRAQKTKKHSFRYNLRLRLSAITGRT